MRRCSRKGREGLNPEQSGHIPHLQRSAHLQHLRGEEIPPGHQAGSPTVPAPQQGESLGTDKSIDRQEKGEENCF